MNGFAKKLSNRVSSSVTLLGLKMEILAVTNLQCLRVEVVFQRQKVLSRITSSSMPYIFILFMQFCSAYFLTNIVDFVSWIYVVDTSKYES